MALPISNTPVLAPTLFDWVDNRTYNKEGIATGIFYVKGSNVRYGMARHNDDGIRYVFIQLIGLQIPYMLFVRLPNRIYNLIKGNFISKGIELGTLDWLAQNSKRSQAGDVVGRSSLFAHIVARSLWELAKEIVKIATYPLAMIALEFSALYGKFASPKDGQKMWSDVEYAWSSNLVDNTGKASLITDTPQFLGACMQPEHVWREAAMHRKAKDYNPLTLRSRMNTIKNQLMSQRGFLEQEGLDVVRMLDNIEIYYRGRANASNGNENRDNYFTTSVSARDPIETTVDGNLNQNEIQTQHANVWTKIQADIDTIFTQRMAIISMQRSFSCASAEINKTQRDQLAIAEDQRKQALSRLTHFCEYWKKLMPTSIHEAMGCDQQRCKQSNT